MSVAAKSFRPDGVGAHLHLWNERQRFLAYLAAHRPKWITSLRDDVLPVFQASGEDSEPFRAALRSWAEPKRITGQPWLMDAVVATLRRWARGVRPKDEEGHEYIVQPTPIIDPLDPSDSFERPMPPFRWHSWGESFAQAVERHVKDVRAHLMRDVRPEAEQWAASVSGMVNVEPRRARRRKAGDDRKHSDPDLDRDLRSFVRVRMEGRSISGVALSADVDRSTVRAAIAKVAASIGWVEPCDGSDVATEGDEKLRG